MTPSRRLLTSMLAVIVLVMALPGSVSWSCMLKTGAVQCCCVTGAEPTCCKVGDHKGGVGSMERTSDDRGDDEGDRDDGDDDAPCGCEDQGPMPPPAEPKIDGDSVLAALPPAAVILSDMTSLAGCVGAAHETQWRCIGPPLYVLFEVFLI